MEEEKNAVEKMGVSDEEKRELTEKGFFRDFIDNIAGVLFSPAQALRKVSFERKIAQGFIVLILSYLLPSLAAVPGSADVLGKIAVPAYGGMTVENIFPGLQNMVPSLVTMSVIFGVLICPLMHFIFTAVMELTAQFLGSGVTALSEGETASIFPLKTGPALFAALAFATLPRVFMAPVNLLVRLTEFNLSPIFGFIFWIWVMILQIIAVRETHGLTTGRAALAYFAPVLAVAALVIMMVVFTLLIFVPVMRNFW